MLHRHFVVCRPLSAIGTRAGTRWAAVMALTAAGVSVHAQNAPSLGPLFYSAAEREAIVRARSGPEEQVKAPSLVHVSGILLREGGKSVAWVNGQAVAEGQAIYPGMPLSIKQGYIMIKNDKVRPGETLDLTSRDRIDTLNRGAVIRQASK